MIRRPTSDSTARAVGLELSTWTARVEHRADLNTAAGELVARSLDVGDDQVDALAEPGVAVVRVSDFTVSTTWKKWGLQPWRVETFAFSTDPELEAKIHDVVGLYLNPPDKAIVLCVDEKSQVQALDRTAPVLPLRSSRRSHRRTPKCSRSGRVASGWCWTSSPPSHQTSWRRRARTRGTPSTRRPPSLACT